MKEFQSVLAASAPPRGFRLPALPLSVISAVSVASLLLLWWLGTTIGGIPSLFWPSPADVVSAFIAASVSLPGHIFATLLRVWSGLVLGATLGIAVGLVMGWNRVVHAALDPLIELLRPVPPISFIPFIILWLGISDVGKVLLITVGSFMVLVVITVEGAQHVPLIYIRAALSLGARPMDIFRTVILPAILPNLVAGIRVATAVAFTLTIASEFMGAQSGLGYYIVFARRILQTDSILVGTIVIGLLAWAMDTGIRTVAKYLMPWSEKL